MRKTIPDLGGRFVMLIARSEIASCGFTHMFIADVRASANDREICSRGVSMRVVAIMLLLFAIPAVAKACGPETRCEVPGGYYLAAVPEDWDQKRPLSLVVYFHGWNSSPEATFRNRVMVRGATDRGALFVAPFAEKGYWRQIGQGRAERGRDEAAYIRAVMEDVRKRWPVDERRTLASGFSRGASMVWNVACYTGDLFRAYAPIAGGFWRSNPEACPTGAVNLRHIHGLSDGVVAFDEVGIYNSMPIEEGFDILAQANGAARASRNVESGDNRLSCERWDESKSGRVLELCLHQRGHSIPAEWVGQGLDWLAALPEGS
ncbi:alpha/beta hydrolase family esterase [Roseibium album]|uniref:alpha/beta hydrolase family esterase n=2 Tax=Roseibium album TaxID=311410 RepID=UPI0039198641